MSVRLGKKPELETAEKNRFKIAAPRIDFRLTGRRAAGKKSEG